MRRTTALLAATIAAVTATGTGPVPAAHAAEALPALVFTSDRDGDTEIYLRKTNGTLQQLTRNRSADHGAVWSPDGRRLAFVSNRDGDDEIFVMNADGSGVRQLTRNGKTAHGAPIRDSAPAWSPDGTRIAFAATATAARPRSTG